MSNNFPLCEKELLQKEINTLKQQLAEQEESEKQMAKALAKVSEEREIFFRALQLLIQKEILFTRQELEDIEINGVSLDDIIRELEQPVGKVGGLDPQRLQRLEQAEKKLLETISQLTAERDRLRAELETARVALAKVTEERNTYRHEMLYLLREEINVGDEEIKEAIRTAVPVDDFLRELGME